MIVVVIFDPVELAPSLTLFQRSPEDPVFQVGTALVGSLSRLLFEGLAVGTLSFAYRRVRVYEVAMDGPAG